MGRLPSVQETAFLLYLKQAKVALNQYELPAKLSNVQSQVRELRCDFGSTHACGSWRT